MLLASKILWFWTFFCSLLILFLVELQLHSHKSWILSFLSVRLCSVVFCFVFMFFWLTWTQLYLSLPTSSWWLSQDNQWVLHIKYYIFKVLEPWFVWITNLYQNCTLLWVTLISWNISLVVRDQSTIYCNYHHEFGSILAFPFNYQSHFQFLFLW